MRFTIGPYLGGGRRRDSVKHVMRDDNGNWRRGWFYPSHFRVEHVAALINWHDETLDHMPPLLRCPRL